MTGRVHDGGEDAASTGADGLAPVIPLFGSGPAPGAMHPARRGLRGSDRAVAPTSADEAPRDDLASRRGARATPEAAQWHRSWIEGEPAGAVEPQLESVDELAARARDTAEKALLRKLRGRSLSIREAYAVLREHDLPETVADGLVDAFVHHGYLDDARLAEQLVHVAVSRKAQGRQAISHALSARGIPREVVEATLAALPDDDADRALAFARSKARSLLSLDHDTAMRRLQGQLARRGFSGPAATAAARQALEEAGGGRSSVRFR